MAEAPLRSLANEAIIAMAGREAFARGMVYVREGRVSGLEFDAERLVVLGRVRGSHNASYATTVQLGGSDRGYTTTHRGRCSCPVVVDCKHAAAVLIAARGLSAVASLLDRPTWERTMTRLAAAADPVQPVEDVRLGLEFEIEQSPSYRGSAGLRSLRVRPVRWGASGRWVRSGMSWDQLDYLSLGYRSEQRDLLLQLWAAAGSAARFAYPRSAWLPLSGVSPSLWSALARASDSALALVPPQGVQRVVVDTRPTAVALDARGTADGGVELRTTVLREGQPMDTGRPGTLGDPAHGLFWVADDPAELRGSRPVRTLTLAPLTRPLTGELRQLVNRAGLVSVPPEDRVRFLSEFVPRIRPAAPVVSADDSVRLPEPVEPVLACTVTFRPEHRVRLDWSFVYQGGTPRSVFDLDEPITRPTFRDGAAESALAAAVDLPYDRLPVLAAEGGRRPAAHALLAGRDAVVFVSEVLPKLQANSVEVSVEGDPIDYRQVDAAPLVELSTVADPDGSDWFDLHITVSVEGERIDFEELFVALTVGEDVLITESGVCIALDRPEFATLRDLIGEAKALREDDRPGLRISTAQVSIWDELLQLGVVVDQSDRWARAVRGLLAVETVDPVEVPATLDAELRPYQVDGFRWLAFLYDHGLGGILADDMGLGKTVQALALICRARAETPGEPPFLVVAPTSVVSNWAREAERFAPGLRVVTVDESQARRKCALAETVAGADMVVTSYTLLRIDIDEFAPLDWRALVLDEAQFVKNHKAKTYQSVRRITAPFKLAITGTPLENNLMDLWSLLSITAPGLFPHPDRFSEFYRLPIERARDAAVLDRLRRRIRPLILRRTKDSVAADLPPKQEQVVDVVLAPRHARVYQTHLQRERQKVLGLVDELDKNRFTILASLTLLRQLALDPTLVDESHAGVPASKVDLLVEQLEELVQEGHRALVFSQFTRFLVKIKERLSAAEISYSYLDGRTRQRGRVIEEFTSGVSSVFLISLKAGGFGLNLTEADYCFVLDPWWNPASEAQAVDRAHRIGQTKPVMVYRLVAKDTIEEKVMELKARKEQLFASIVGDDALADAALTADEIRGLLAG